MVSSGLTSFESDRDVLKFMLPHITAGCEVHLNPRYKLAFISNGKNYECNVGPRMANVFLNPGDKLLSWRGDDSGFNAQSLSKVIDPGANPKLKVNHQVRISRSDARRTWLNLRSGSTPYDFSLSLAKSSLGSLSEILNSPFHLEMRFPEYQTLIKGIARETEYQFNSIVFLPNTVRAEQVKSMNDQKGYSKSLFVFAKLSAKIKPHAPTTSVWFVELDGGKCQLCHYKDGNLFQLVDAIHMKKFGLGVVPLNNTFVFIDLAQGTGVYRQLPDVQTRSINREIVVSSSAVPARARVNLGNGSASDSKVHTGGRGGPGQRPQRGRGNGKGGHGRAPTPLPSRWAAQDQRDDADKEAVIRALLGTEQELSSAILAESLKSSDEEDAQDPPLPEIRERKYTVNTRGELTILSKVHLGQDKNNNVVFGLITSPDGETEEAYLLKIHETDQGPMYSAALYEEDPESVSWSKHYNEFVIGPNTAAGQDDIPITLDQIQTVADKTTFDGYKPG